MKKYKVFSYIIIGAVITTLLLLATCNNIICSNAEGRLYTDIGSIPPSEVGLLLGTTPQTRIGHKPNQFFKYRIDATESLYKAGKIKLILISGDGNSLDGINEVECMKDSLVARGIPKMHLFWTKKDTEHSTLLFEQQKFITCTAMSLYRRSSTASVPSISQSIAGLMYTTL